MQAQAKLSKPEPGSEKRGRTTVGAAGDWLAARPGKSIDAIALAAELNVNRTATNLAGRLFEQIEAITIDRTVRPNTFSMSAEQARRWKDGHFEAALKKLGKSVDMADIQFGRRGAKVLVTEPRAGKPLRTLRFAHWDDGAVIIAGLKASNVTLSAETVRKLASLFSQLPEGWIDLLTGAAISLQFALNIDGRETPVAPGEMRQLVDYIEQLPARLVGAMDTPRGRVALSVLKPGSDNRVHRLETAADRED